MAHLSPQNQRYLYGLQLVFLFSSISSKRLREELVEPGHSGMVSTCHDMQLAAFHQVHYRIRKKDSERCDSTGSTEESEATRVLELLEPGADFTRGGCRSLGVMNIGERSHNGYNCDQSRYNRLYNT